VIVDVDVAYPQASHRLHDRAAIAGAGQPRATMARWSNH
jgi:hypothetical protein